MLDNPKQQPEPVHQHESLTSDKLATIADQICEFIWSYDITVNEARMIASLIPTFINEIFVRIGVKRDQQIELGNDPEEREEGQ